MKKYLLAMAIMMIGATSFAQDTEEKKVVFSVGAEGAIPIGDSKDAYSAGFGATAQVEYMVAEKFGVTLNAGYINFSGKTYTIPGLGTVKGGSIGQIPILAGFRYYFIKDIYFSGQLGFSSFTKGGGTAFTYAPGVGAKFSVLDVTLKYLGAPKNGATFSTVGLRVAYSF